MDAFQYGAYKEFYDDPRTQKALKELDNMATLIKDGVKFRIYRKN